MKAATATPEEPDDEKKKEAKLRLGEMMKMPWFIPPVIMQLADGSFLMRTGKPVLRVQANKAAKLSGLSTKTLLRLAETGFITRDRPTPYITFYYPGEIEDFIRRTREDPDFWNEVTTKSFLTGKEFSRDRKVLKSPHFTEGNKA